jgi:uncharacterized protein YneF (UPF0154 family)
MSFQSYEVIKYLGYDQKTKEYRYEYKIVDDDWVGVGVGVVVGVGVWVGVWVAIAVIQEYSKRDLPIVPNLVRAFQWYSQNYGYSIEQIIAWNKQYNPIYKDYEQDIERYMLLL